MFGWDDDGMSCEHDVVSHLEPSVAVEYAIRPDGTVMSQRHVSSVCRDDCSSQDPGIPAYSYRAPVARRQRSLRLDECALCEVDAGRIALDGGGTSDKCSARHTSAP